MKYLICFILIGVISCNFSKEALQATKDNPVKQQLALVISNFDSMDIRQIDSVLADYMELQFVNTVDTTSIERFGSDTYYALNIQYSRDTFFLRTAYNLMLEANPNPTGMMIANDYRRNKTYDLINHYYEKALVEITPVFRSKLIENQELWKKSQESDIVFSNLVLSEEYTGDFTPTRALYIDYTNPESRLHFLFSCYLELQGGYQGLTRNVLTEKLKDFDADSGLLLLMNRDGKLMAEVNLSIENEGYRDSYKTSYSQEEIGSLFAPVSIFIGLNDKKFLSTDIIDTGEGIFIQGNDTITDHNANRGGYGEITVEQAITLNSNVGIAKIISDNYGTSQFRKSLSAIGLDASIDNNATLALLSCGYGIKINPISILSFYNDIANDRINAPKLKNMLRKTIKEGVAKSVDSDQVNIAGKSGIYLSDSKTVVSFCGSFPANNPDFTCLVIITNPKSTNPSGSIIAGDVVRRIAEDYY